MAKKKRAAKPKEDSKFEVSTDDIFQEALTGMQNKLQRKGRYVGHEANLIMLPTPSFAFRYLLNNTGLPFSQIYQLVGPQASYKSTLAMEILRWHRLCGGGGILAEAETKPTPELRNSVLNWDTAAVNIEDCGSLEDWQRVVVWFIDQFKSRCEKGPGRTIPCCIVVDSLLGKASEYTLKNIRQEGHASAHYPIEARELADFMRAFPQELLGWPITFVGVNHLKVAKSPDGSIDYNIPGGWSLKFQCAGILDLSRMGAIKEYSNYSAATVRMGLLKNSHGPDNRRINVRFKTWHAEDDHGVMRLHSRFEWWEASILLLSSGFGLTKAGAEKFLAKVKDVCDIREVSGGSAGKLYWSKRLDVPRDSAMPAHDLGVLLEKSPAVLRDLYNVLGITQRPCFKPGVDFLSHQEGYEYVLDQNDMLIQNESRIKDIMREEPQEAEEGR